MGMSSGQEKPWAIITILLLVVMSALVHWIVSLWNATAVLHTLVEFFEFIGIGIFFLLGQNKARTIKKAQNIKEDYHYLVPARLIENLPAAVISVNKTGEIININALAREISGLTEGDGTGNLYDLSYSADSPLYFLKQTLEGKQVYDDQNFTVNLSGVTKYFWLRTSKILDSQGQLTGALLIAWNISEQKILEKQLSQREKLAMIGELAAGTAHEIRNPLTSVRGLIQVLESRFPKEDPAREHITVMLKEIDYINHIIKELLLLARRSSPNLSFASLPAVLDQILLLVEGESSRKGIYIHKDYKNDSPLVVLDEDQMKQVFLHLATNAIHAMPTGGVLSVHARYLKQEDMITVSFQDTGMGIPEENLSRIFHPFFTTRPEGTGLGLPISYQIVDNHGGNLSVQSVVGKGSCFTVKLPLVSREIIKAS